MKSALEKGRTEFVELLLEHGVNMAKFLTLDRLESLYNVVSIKEVLYLLQFSLVVLYRFYSLILV